MEPALAGGAAVVEAGVTEEVLLEAAVDVLDAGADVVC